MIEPSEPQDAAAVAAHYDDLDRFYREVWGEHVHHGLWTTGRETPGEAADALVDHLASRLGLEAGQSLCDIGCGYGATARRLARLHGVRVTGLTVSPVQAARAAEAAAGEPNLAFLRRDWMENGLEEASFDRAFSIESSEHMVDKARFFAEARRILRPGGRFGVYAWLAREGASPREVRHLLEPICREGRLPGMGTEAEYRALAEGAGLRVTGFEDLSARVSRTWTVCARRVAWRIATRPDYRRFLLDRGSRNRVFAATLLRILVAYRVGAMRYGLMLAERD